MNAMLRMLRCFQLVNNPLYLASCFSSIQYSRYKCISLSLSLCLNNALYLANCLIQHRDLVVGTGGVLGTTGDDGSCRVWCVQRPIELNHLVRPVRWHTCKCKQQYNNHTNTTEIMVLQSLKCGGISQSYCSVSLGTSSNSPPLLLHVIPHYISFSFSLLRAAAGTCASTGRRKALNCCSFGRTCFYSTE